MINKKTTKVLQVYSNATVKKAMKKAAKDHKTSSSSLAGEIISKWLVKNKYLKTIRVQIVDL